jgi:hypothetical protein
MTRVIVGIAFLLFVGVVATNIGDRPKVIPRSVEPKLEAFGPEKPLPAPVKPPEVKYGELDRSYGVLKGDFTLINTNDFAIRDARMVCDVIAGSGTTIHTYRFDVFEIIPAKGRKTVKGYTFGFWPQQGKSLSCYSTSADRR